MQPTSQNKQFWLEFIELYKSLPALWKVKSECYRNRELKNQGYQVMIEKLKELEPDACRELVKKKINALRTNYRRELKKLRNYRHNNDGDECVPSLWYFKEIDFLRETESTQDPGVDDDDDNILYHLIESNDDTISNPQSPDTHTRLPPKRKAPTEHNKTTDDELEYLGKIWAMEYKKLSPDQQIFAKKAINDVLFEGRLGTLHRHSDPMSMLDVQFSRISTLQEIATFEIALQLWRINGIEAMVSQYCPFSCEIIGDLPTMEDIVKTVQGSLLFWYPRLPVFMANDIVHAVKSIGNEIQSWKRIPRLAGRLNINQISHRYFYWSYSRTNDRLKTVCSTKKFNLNDTKICGCCFENYVGPIWYNTSPEMQRFYTNFFGDYKYHALVFEKFYLEHFLEINVLQQYFNPEDTALENIFYLSVYFVYNEAVVSYWSQLSNTQQKKNVNKAIDIFFDSCCSNNITERKTSTFTFLWNKLDVEKRAEIMETKFYHVLRLLLPWPMTEYLVPVLDSRETVDYDDPIYFLLLWETAKKIPRGFHETDQYRNLFTLLCGRALRALKVYRVQHLILTLLEYPEDLDMAVKIMMFYDYRKKRRIIADLFSYPRLAIKPVLVRGFVDRVCVWPRYRFRRRN